MRCKFALIAVAALLLCSPFTALADNGDYSGSGGTFTAGTTNITTSGVPLSGVSGSYSFNCPVTSYTSQNWACTGGSITITTTDNSVTLNGTFAAASMVETAYGGGRGHPTTYVYNFYGPFTGTVTVGTVTQAVTGALTQNVTTTSNSGTAPVSYALFGWDSANSPVLVGDSTSLKIFSADNITGANLAAYGGPGKGTGKFESLAGLAQDATGHIYATDSILNRVIRIDDITGLHWTKLGVTGSGTKQFTQPKEMAIDAAGKIWVADSGNNRIVRFDDMTGKNWTAFGTLGSGNNQFSGPSSIAFDSTGRIYVADTNNNRIVRFDDLNGTNWTTLSQVTIGIYLYSINAPASLAVNKNGRIYVTLYGGNNGDSLLSVDDMTGTNPALTNWGAGLAAISVDPSGTVFVAGSFSKGLAQVEDAKATGYFTSNMNQTNFHPSAVLAANTTSPPPGVPMVSPTSLSFGKQNVGEPGPGQQVTLTNLGAEPLAISSVTASQDFQVNNGCSTSLAGAQSCTITLSFDPVATGPRMGSLTVQTTSAHPSLNLALSGTGTQPQAALLPGTLTFSTQQTGTTSGAQVASLTNNGTGPLTIASINSSGPFSQTSNCPTVVAAGSGCIISVVFQPTAVGPVAGAISITDDAALPSATQTLNLQGTGSAAGPAFLLTPQNILFPDQKVKSVSTAQTVTLQNNSGAKVTVLAPTFSAGFKGTSQCKSLANGGTCTIQVQFAPTAAGPITGTVTIPISGFPSQTLAVAGTGTSGAASMLSVNPTSINFGQVNVGNNPFQDVTITNTTGLPVAVHITLTDTTGAYSLTSNNCPSTLTGNATCTVQVTFSPSESLTYNASLAIAEGSGAKTTVSIVGYGFSQ